MSSFETEIEKIEVEGYEEDKEMEYFLNLLFYKVDITLYSYRENEETINKKNSEYLKLLIKKGIKKGLDEFFKDINEQRANIFTLREKIPLLVDKEKEKRILSKNINEMIKNSSINEVLSNLESYSKKVAECYVFYLNNRKLYEY